jgi:acetylxylan esterase
MNKFSSVLRSYCDSTDPVCADAGPGPFVVDNHLNYFDRYSDDAGGWVKYVLGY